MRWSAFRVTLLSEGQKFERAGFALHIPKGSLPAASPLQHSGGSVHIFSQQNKLAQLRRNRAAQAVGVEAPARGGEYAVGEPAYTRLQWSAFDATLLADGQEGGTRRV